MSEYTPGPWKVINKEKSIGYADYEISYSENGEAVKRAKGGEK